MPLTPPAPRERLHTRSVVGDGYLRRDGLFDIEARLVDTKSRPYPLMSGVREPGEPIHDMWIRITIDREFTIHAVDASMPSIPYPDGCDRIEAAYQQLVGANLMHGFRSRGKVFVGVILTFIAFVLVMSMILIWLGLFEVMPGGAP